MSESFWDFSVRTYRTEHVPEACLSLQDERGVDVNMLLYCCWFGVTRGQQQAEAFQNVFDFSETWAERVVRPLRYVRTWMKFDGCHDPRMPTETCMEYRERVKGVEFEAEKIQQDVLESLTLPIPEKDLALPDQLIAIAKNVGQYFDRANIVSDEFVQERLLTIIQAEVVDFSEKDIRVALKSNTREI
jgi:uncharacterized protein (TIGR02444 family)